MWTYNHTIPVELYHHGVKGQKWGVKNGPPYPIKRAENTVAKTTENSTIVKDAIASGSVSLTVNPDKQRRHTKAGHTDGRSYLDGDIEFAQDLINKLSGTGEPVMDKNGEWTHKERVTNPQVIGTCADNQKSNLGMIVYSNTGTHIYPRKRG